MAVCGPTSSCVRKAARLRAASEAGTYSHWAEDTFGVYFASKDSKTPEVAAEVSGSCCFVKDRALLPALTASLLLPGNQSRGIKDLQVNSEKSVSGV